MTTNSSAIQDKTYRILSGHAEAQEAIDNVIGRAGHILRAFDHDDLGGRGFNGVARDATLRKFLMADRINEMRIVLHETGRLERDCPRLLNLLREHPVAIKIHRATGVALQANDPFIIADDAHFWHQLHYQHPRSVLSLDSTIDAKPMLERFEEIWLSSEVAVSASTIGL